MPNIKCPNCGEIISDDEAFCYYCGAILDENFVPEESEQQNSKQEQLANHFEQKQTYDIAITSSSFFQGYIIDEYINFISSEIVIGMGVFKSLFASLSNVTGTKSNSLSKKLEETRFAVTEQIKRKAYELGANAIVSFDIDYTMFGETMVGIIANGTAVKIHKYNTHSTD